MVILALDHPECSKHCDKAANDPHNHNRVVVVFFNNKQERSEKLLESNQDHKELVQTLLKLLPKIPEHRKSTELVNKLRREIQGFGWSLIVESVSKSTAPVPTEASISDEFQALVLKASRNAGFGR